MKGIWLLLIGLCFIVSGCISQNPEGTAIGNDQQSSPPPQDMPSGQQGQRGWGGFSQEAADACAGKAANDSCEFQLNETLVKGACRSRRGGQLTCFPSNMNQGPPQEMIDACIGKSVNESCEVKLLNNTILKGSCISARTEGLMCFSSNMGQRTRPGPGGLPGQQNQRPLAEQGMPEGDATDSLGGD